MATTTVKAYGATASTEDLKPLDIERRAVGTDDVKLISLIVVFVIVTYIQQETNGMDQPIVPGHEIIGRVVEVGNAVTSHKVGDLVGVGCMVDSCQPCSLQARFRTILRKWSNIYLQQSRQTSLKQTYGGYSTSVVVDENLYYAFRKFR
jgi:uncharacterized zinc-type alcohol dehydrogenase-like protein